MYRFALRPRWMVSHLVVAALIVGMLAAGVWQLSRLGDRQDRNETIAARALLTEVDVATIAPPGSGFGLGEEAEYLRVSATGTFDRSAEVLVRNRPRDGAPGRWVLTPLVLDDGRAVVVNRGWIPNAIDPDEPRPEVDPPTGEVTITGFVRATEVARGLQADDRAEGILTTVARPNLERLAQQIDQPLLPVWIQLDALDGPENASGLPVPVPLPPLDDGPHLGYAAQWFIFATIGVVGYPLILRRIATRPRLTAERDEGVAELEAREELAGV